VTPCSGHGTCYLDGASSVPACACHEGFVAGTQNVETANGTYTFPTCRSSQHPLPNAHCPTAPCAVLSAWCLALFFFFFFFSQQRFGVRMSSTCPPLVLLALLFPCRQVGVQLPLPPPPPPLVLVCPKAPEHAPPPTDKVPFLKKEKG